MTTVDQRRHLLIPLIPALYVSNSAFGHVQILENNAPINPLSELTQPS